MPLLKTRWCWIDALVLFLLCRRRNRQGCGRNTGWGCLASTYRTTLLCLPAFLLVLFIVWLKTKNRTVSVFTVEEHHEALYYWLGAVERGQLANSGVTLVHVDGHSDCAFPDISLPFTPLFRFPRSPLEADSLMQSNDVFIMGTVMTGLINHVVWVLPEWAEEAPAKPESKHIQIGWTEAVLPDIPPRRRFCMCETKESTDAGGAGDSATEQLSCLVMPSSLDLEKEMEKDEAGENEEQEKKGSEEEGRDLEEQFGEGIPLPDVSLCLDRRELFLETLTVPQALQLQQERPDWLPRRFNSLIVDIDEDFFGVEVPGVKLVEAGIPWTRVTDLDGLMTQLFCPAFMEHEIQAKTIVSAVYVSFSEICRFPGKDSGDLCAVSKELATSHTGKPWLSLKTAWQAQADLFCARDDSELYETFHSLVTELHTMTSSQFTVLRMTGVCLIPSPKTLGFTEEAEIVICHGSNPPDDLMVELHPVTSAAEIDRDLLGLRNLIGGLCPGLVTVARSSRDGYTPREWQSYIEKGLIDIFMEETREKDGGEKIGGVKGERRCNFKVRYDPDLMKIVDGEVT